MAAPDPGSMPALLPPASRSIRWLRIAAGVLFYAASLVLLVEAAQRDWLEGWSEQLSAADISAALAFALFARVLTARCWSGLLRGHRPSPTTRDGREWAIYAVTALGKYIPGKLLTVAARTYLSRNLQVPLPHAVEAASREPLLNIGAVTATGGLLLLGNSPGWGALLAIAGSIVMLASLRADTSWLWHRLRQIRVPVGTGTDPTMARPRLSIGLLALGAAVTQGACVLVIAVVQLPGIDAQGASSIVGTFMISHVAGVLVFLAPAGMGVREGVQAALLSGYFSAGTIAAFLVSCRLVDIAADTLFAIGGAVRLLALRNFPATANGPQDNV